MNSSLDVEPGDDVGSRSIDALSGFRLPLEGLALLWRERSLWPLAVVPVLLSLLAFAAAIGFVVAYAGELYGWATAWIPTLEVDRWWEWLWLGPARALLAALGAALFLTLAAACLVAAYVLASVLASPFHDALAGRVEQIVTGRVVDAGATGLRGIVSDAARSVREELRRMAFLVALTAPLVLAGVFVPGAQLVTGPALVLVAVFFLPLDYASYALDRRRLAFSEKRRWLLARKTVMLGFGSAAFLVCAVPGLSFLAMPALVTAGTLLVIRARDGGAGRATSP